MTKHPQILTIMIIVRQNSAFFIFSWWVKTVKIWYIGKEKGGKQETVTLKKNWTRSRN